MSDLLVRFVFRLIRWLLAVAALGWACSGLPACGSGAPHPLAAGIGAPKGPSQSSAGASGSMMQGSEQPATPAAAGQPSARAGEGGAGARVEVAGASSAAGVAAQVPPAADGGAAAGAGGDAGAAAGAAGMAGPPEVCSGCSSEQHDPMDMTVHLHHVHLTAANRAASERFYQTHLAAKPVKLNGVSDALYVAPVLLLIDEKPSPRADLPTALQHIGWGSKDPAAWYAKAHAAGVPPDTRGNTLFNTSEMPTVGAEGSGASTFALLGAQPPACYPVPDRVSYMYVLGPDKERIEIWSGVDERVNHVHFTTADLGSTVGWYEKFLGLPMTSGVLFAAFFLDDILFFFEPVGTRADYRPTDDHVLSHVAFSVSNLDAWRARAVEQKIEIVAPRAEMHGFDSFFIRGPDGTLIELVEARPSKDFCH